MTAVNSIRGLTAYFQSLVHESVRGDAIIAARHQSFIGSHLLGGLLAFAVFPVYLAVLGRPTMLTAAAFVWFLSPIAIAIFLSRTGRLGAAHLISAANLTGLVCFAAGITGGAGSFLIAWIVVVPLEAALSTQRRVVLSAIGIACAGLAALAITGNLGLLPPPLALSHDPVALALLGSMSALIYAGGLAISVQIVHRQSAETISAGERRYRLLAENATDMITRHDARGRVLFASIAAKQILGVPAERLMDNGLFERIHVADRPAFLNALDHCVSEHEPASIEFRVSRSPAADDARTGATGFIWVEMRCKPVLDDTAGEGDAATPLKEVVAVTRDISERKAQELELLKARDEAEGASRAKSQFLANMSHELRTPLNAIIGFSEILKRELYGNLGDVRYGEYARLIHESGEHLLNVVNEILDMSKIEAGKFTIVSEPFDIAGLVASCCEIMRHQAEKKSIDLKTDIASGLGDLTADKRACKQILLNLLSNAIKFTGDAGRVVARARRDGETIEISVRDNGIGISEEDLPRLGEPFVQADNTYQRSYEGAGLGLSVVKGLVSLHGGTMLIESRIGVGTTVRIRLPREGAAAGDPFPADEPIAVPLRDSKAIKDVSRTGSCREQRQVASIG